MSLARCVPVVVEHFEQFVDIAGAGQHLLHNAGEYEDVAGGWVVINGDEISGCCVPVIDIVPKGESIKVMRRGQMADSANNISENPASQKSNCDIQPNLII